MEKEYKKFAKGKPSSNTSLSQFKEEKVCKNPFVKHCFEL